MTGDLIEVNDVLLMIAKLEEELKSRAVAKLEDIYDHRSISGSYGTLQDLKQRITSHIKQQRN